MITWNEMLIQVLAGFVGTYAFSLTYSVSPRHFFFAGLTGGIGWAAYIVCFKIFGFGAVISNFISTLFIATSARCFAVWRRCPSMIFLIPGLFPIVPGAGIYWSFYYLFVNNLDKSLEFGLLAIKSRDIFTCEDDGGVVVALFKRLKRVAHSLQYGLSTEVRAADTNTYYYLCL